MTSFRYVPYVSYVACVACVAFSFSNHSDSAEHAECYSYTSFRPSLNKPIGLWKCN